MHLQEINEKSNEVFIVEDKAYLKTCTIQLCSSFLNFTICRCVPRSHHVQLSNKSAPLFNSSFDHWCPSVFWRLCFSAIVPRLKLEQASATSLATSATYLLLCVSYIHTVATFYFLSLAHCLIYIHCVSNLCAPHPTQWAVNIPEQAVLLISGVLSLPLCPSVFFITVDLIKIAFTLLKLVSSAWYSSVSFVGLYSLHLCGRSGCKLLFLGITSLLSYINLQIALCSMPNLEPGIVLVIKLWPV